MLIVAAVASVLLIWSLAALVSTFVTFNLDFFSLSWSILSMLAFSPMIVLLSLSDSLGVIFSFDLHLDF